MAPLGEWFKPARTLVLSLVCLTLAAVCALLWSTWRLVQQQQLLQQQQIQEELERIADHGVTSLRAAFAEVGDRLGEGQNALSSGESVLFSVSEGSLTVAPPAHLLFYPTPIDQPEADLQSFSNGEYFEFVQNRPVEALSNYRALSAAQDDAVRAGALVRIARVLRKTGRLAEARAAYRSLASITSVQVAGIPADLIGNFELAESFASKRGKDVIRTGLLEGRWHLTRGQFVFYWAQVADVENCRRMPSPFPKRPR